ncbi:unnamed protein product [Prunus armeniaca]
MTFPKFWTQSDMDWSVKLDDSGSCDVRYEMVLTKFTLKWSGWCIAYFYPLDFTQNTPNDSSHRTMMFPKFWTQSDIDWSIQFYPLDFTENTTNDSSHHIMMFPKFWTQSDKDWFVKLDDSGSYEVRSEMEWLVYCFYPLDFTQNTPNDSSNHIMMFPMFWTQSDMDWFVKLDDSSSYEVRSEMEWFVYCVVLSIGFR